MSLSNFKNIINLNGYSWSILIAFLGALVSMHFDMKSISVASILLTLPLIFFIIYYSERLVPLIKQPDHTADKRQSFIQDLFIISYSFLFACLISLVISYDNSAVKGWWPLMMYFITIYGLLFSFCFAIVAMLLKNHKHYTLSFALLIIGCIITEMFLPFYLFIPFLGYFDTFYVITSLLFILHCLFALSYKIIHFKKK